MSVVSIVCSIFLPSPVGLSYMCCLPALYYTYIIIIIHEGSSASAYGFWVIRIIYDKGTTDCPRYWFKCWGQIAITSGTALVKVIGVVFFRLHRHHWIQKCELDGSCIKGTTGPSSFHLLQQSTRLVSSTPSTKFLHRCPNSPAANFLKGLSKSHSCHGC